MVGDSKNALENKSTIQKDVKKNYHSSQKMLIDHLQCRQYCQNTENLKQNMFLLCNIHKQIKEHYLFEYY